MSHPGIFSTDQLALIRKLYLRQLLPPREVAREVNRKFGTNFTPRQISSMLVERGLSKRRKLAKGKAILAANDFTSLAAVHQRAELTTTRDIVAGHLRLGQKITAKAEHFVDVAASAKSLSSATGSARSGISIIRQALGLDDNTAQNPLRPVFDIHFARGPGSPFSPENMELDRLKNMKRAEMQRIEAAPEQAVLDLT
jgi:hypothetical protein